MRFAREREAARKAERKADRARLQALKPRRALMREAQRVFNAYIRERDASLPCISCGRHHKGAWDAGHYLSVGSHPELAFDEANVHRQCVPCNQHKSGNALAYRKGLIRRIGLEEVERLEGPHAPKKWTRDQLELLKAVYAAKRRAMVAQRKGDE